MGGLSVPSEEFFDGFVTWPALEDALKGLRDSLPAEQTSSMPGDIERTVVEASDQTDVVSTEHCHHHVCK